MSAFHNNVDVHSEIFTPNEFPVEILEIGKEKDVIAACLSPASKQFFTFMLFQEYKYKADGVSIYINNSIDAKEFEDADVKDENSNPEDDQDQEEAEDYEFPDYNNDTEQKLKALEIKKSLSCLTSLKTLSNIPTIYYRGYEDDHKVNGSDFIKPCIIVCNSKSFCKLLQTSQQLKECIKLVVIENVNDALVNDSFQQDLLEILSIIRNINQKDQIRTILLTVSLLHYYGSQSMGFWKLKESFVRLKNLCGIQVDTTSSIVSILKYSPVPLEKIIPYENGVFTKEARELTIEAKRFINDLKIVLLRHHFNPADLFGELAITGEEDEESIAFAAELERIPNPIKEPLEIIERLLSILERYGPWAANRAIVLLSILVERLKVRTPYERHYILLGLLQTRLISLQSIFENAFETYEPIQVLEKFSSPKLNALLSILRRFDLKTQLDVSRRQQLSPSATENQNDEDDDDEGCIEPPVPTPKPSSRGGNRRRNMANKRKQQYSNEINQQVSVSVSTDLSPPSKPAISEEGETSLSLPSPSPEIKSEIKTNPVKVVRHNKRNTKSNKSDENPLCALVLLEDRFDARMIFHFLKEAALSDPNLIGLNPTIAVCSNPEFHKDSKEAELDYKKREECLRKFRYREANLLVGTSLLDGIELPKSNLVIRFDSSKSFRSYMFSKGKAQTLDAEYYIFTESEKLSTTLNQLAGYKLTEEILLENTIIPKSNVTKSIENTKEETYWNSLIPDFYSANLSNSISIINRYCARLPSDTFTRLTPLWSISESISGDKENETCKKLYTCTLRLPINSPVKWPIQGISMPSEKLAKSIVALQTCKILHENHELDDHLMPIGKEGIAQEPDIEIPPTITESEDEFMNSGEFRPGSTKRRQYYDKKMAPELTTCLITNKEKRFYLYWINLLLTCPIPEEQNTRGRKVHPPEKADQWFGFILSNELPQIPPFPIYTRCGEVRVQIIRINNDGDGVPQTLNEDQLRKISAFHHYTFTSVLRLDKYLSFFDPNSAESSYYILPLKKVEMTPRAVIDWEFIDKIWKAKEITRPPSKSNEDRKDFVFKEDEYLDAVVMPWYRNHDIPQYFYVAEITTSLTPRSQFPGCEFKTFEEYYEKKYNILIQNSAQPLLDVDHTSARLNFLTPRYVNRKGMLLPTSSETTKKAKRENLEQKQILVPELCAIHPFPANLWRQAVCLPCILYRMNILLLANDLRTKVALQIHGLGKPSLDIDIIWDPLNFGWNLIDIIQLSSNIANNNDATNCIQNAEEASSVIDNPTEVKSEESFIEEINDEEEEEKKRKVEEGSKEKDSSKNENEKKDEKKEEKKEEISGFAKAAKEAVPVGISIIGESLLSNDKFAGKSANEILSEKLKTLRPLQLEIGMWSNDLFAPPDSSNDVPKAKVNKEPEKEEIEDDFDEDEDELLDPNVALPSNLTMLDKNWAWGGRSRLFNHKVHRALYGSPTHWGDVWDEGAFVPIEDLEATNFDDMGENASIASDMSHSSNESFLDEENNLKIQFHNGNTAEAMDKRKFTHFDHRPDDEMMPNEDEWWKELNHSKEIELEVEFDELAESRAKEITNIIPWDSIQNLPERTRKSSALKTTTSTSETKIEDKDKTPDPYYEKLFNSTESKPPTLFPESVDFKKDVKLEGVKETQFSFSFDHQPSLSSHPGPNPCQILQAFTMSNANDGVNLERLETIGDSFLKYAITTYLFCNYPNIHEGKLSHLRSKQVSNVHLYRLGRQRGLGGLMVAAKFEPHDNWLPPCYHIPKDLDKAIISSKGSCSMGQVKVLKDLPPNEIENALREKNFKSDSDFVPYNIVTQQSIPDKSIADCVEALIGCYLTSTGPHGALLFMSWLGMRVLPSSIISKNMIEKIKRENPQEELFFMDINNDKVHMFRKLPPPRSPLLRFSNDCEIKLKTLLKGYDQFEESISYKFRDQSYLLQAFTHASYSTNNLTDCYQRLEFLGDAILDYLITRHLYEDSRCHSPGSLTDLRSALVNNTIFASLAVKNSFHKYFRHSSPGLSTVLQKFVAFQELHGNTLTQDYYLMGEDECEEAEDIEVPKALGDVFESVAGAIYLDSGMSLDAVWNVYFRIMKNEIELFSENVPKSPIRELLELEPETAKFGRPEKLMDGRRVRVSVEIFGVGVFKGIGRNYRIAKCTAAKCALKHVKKLRHRQANKF